MSVPMSIDRGQETSLPRRLAARGAVAAARPLSALPPRRIRAVLELLRTGARPATTAQAQAARDAVVAVSTRCAGQYCIQRSLATALLCRMSGTWPTWRAGIRTAPFRAHAWVEADGQPVGEPRPAGYYTPPHRRTVAAPLKRAAAIDGSRLPGSPATADLRVQRPKWRGHRPAVPPPARVSRIT